MTGKAMQQLTGKLQSSQHALLQIRGFPCDCSFPEECDSQASQLPPTRLQQQEHEKRLRCQEAAPSLACGQGNDGVENRSNGGVAGRQANGQLQATIGEPYGEISQYKTT